MPKTPREKLTLKRYNLKIGDKGPKEGKTIGHPGVGNAWEWYDANYDSLPGKKKWHLNLIMDKMLKHYKFLLDNNRNVNFDFKLTKTIKEYARLVKPYKARY